MTANVKGTATGTVYLTPTREAAVMPLHIPPRAENDFGILHRLLIDILFEAQQTNRMLTELLHRTPK